MASNRTSGLTERRTSAELKPIEQDEAGQKADYFTAAATKKAVSITETDPFPLADRVDPSTAEEHRNAAVQAIAMSLFGIILYVAFRFRSWAFQLVYVQLGILYFWSAVTKTSAAWLNGSGVQSMLKEQALLAPVEEFAMEQEEVQAAFVRFAAPMMSLVALGADKKAANELSRNLWVAMIGGPGVEQEVFDAMRDTDSDLYDVLHRCYTEQMKTQVSADELAALRERYGPMSS